MQYHEVKISLELREARDCYWAGAQDATAVGGYAADWSRAEVGSLKAASLFVDYIYLKSRVEKQPGCIKAEIPASANKLVVSSSSSYKALPQLLVGRSGIKSRRPATPSNCWKPLRACTTKQPAKVGCG